MKHSPPHRWLRKSSKTKSTICIYSPPHRWLRNDYMCICMHDYNSPLHRWLRKLSCTYLALVKNKWVKTH
ncbi:hypothetical protein BAZOLSSOX_2261 [uncultured Gammaproteobacteria bacterium]|nr:hypothetical protein BAZOLSSOX_2261 [uncultured Gammaproteobacteria bacterium]